MSYSFNITVSADWISLVQRKSADTQEAGTTTVAGTAATAVWYCYCCCCYRGRAKTPSTPRADAKQTSLC